MTDVPMGFFEHVDAHINLSNHQINDGFPKGQVSASTMYASARFCAWLTATGCTSAEDMASRRDQAKAFFADEFTRMFDESYREYTDNFDQFLKAQG